MILAGGTGEELSVLTGHRAKTALPFGGHYRIIDFCLSNCVHSGIFDIAVLAQYSPKSLIEHIRMGKPWDLDRKSGGVHILQPSHYGEAAQWYLGTADALYQNIEMIRNSRAELVLVLSGDQVYLMDYLRMAAEHVDRGIPATIAIKEISPDERSRFGMVCRSRDGLITSFMEKPVSSNYRFASLGIYLFNRDFLVHLLESSRVDIVFDIVIPLIEKRSVAGFVFDGYWEDIGSISSYYTASMNLLKDRAIIVSNEWPIFSRSANLPPAKFSRNSSVRNSIIAEGCHVKGAVRRSILFPGVFVDRDAAVTDSIIFASSRVGKDAAVTRSIIDKSVRIGKGARIGVRRERTGGTVRGKRTITLVGKGARIAPGVDLPRGGIVGMRSNVKECR